jgi:Ubiquinone biosynthesis protein COQ7
MSVAMRPCSMRAARYASLRRAAALDHGGHGVGFVTALMGTNAVMICTEAVERAVHAHLNAQLVFLGGRDPVLGDAVRAVRDEEVGHHDRAHDARTAFGPFARARRFRRRHDDVADLVLDLRRARPDGAQA